MKQFNPGIRKTPPNETNSNLMFDKASIEESSHPLVRLLRLIFYRKKITLDGFSALYAQYGNRIGSSNYHITTHCTNARRALRDPANLTYHRFQYELYNILRLNVVEVAVTIRDETTGELTTYRSTDAVD